MIPEYWETWGRPRGKRLRSELSDAISSHNKKLAKKRKGQRDRAKRSRRVNRGQ